MNNWPSGSYRIFISYAREDAHDVAIILRDDLAAAGHDAWLDVAEIAAGASWARDIEEAIENCDLVLALLSHGAYVSDICRGEQLRALRKNKRLIPVLVQPDADRPLHLENLNYVDFSDPAYYDRLFADLLSYIETGYVPRANQSFATHNDAPPVFPPQRARSSQGPSIKRDARAFRRYLEDLREEGWLGDRHWWTYALFYYADVQQIARVLGEGQLHPPAHEANANGQRSSQRRSGMWGRYVRLNFRPRTPDLFGVEGILPEAQRSFGHCALPVYLLFDLESVIVQPNARFSSGDVTQTGVTYKSATAFRDLPFDLIYHDGSFTRQERDEILTARRAQVLLPHALDLVHLRHIWCRSEAEAETLRSLLPGAAWRRWGDKVTVRGDYELFNRHRVFVQRAELLPEGVHFVLNLCRGGEDECGPFEARLEITSAGQTVALDLGEFQPEVEFGIDLTPLQLRDAYTLRLYLDDVLAYAGSYNPVISSP